MKDLGPLPRLHPRRELTEKLHAQLRQALDEAGDSAIKLGLTENEYDRAVMRVFTEHMNTRCTQRVRRERHGNKDMGADEA